MKMDGSTLAVVFLVVLASAGCERLQERPYEGPGPEVAEDPDGSRPANASPELKKLRSYDRALSGIGLSLVKSNLDYMRVFGVAARYTSRKHDGKSEPFIRKHGLDIGEIRASSHELTSLKSAIATKPTLETIDAAGRAFEQRLTELKPLVADAHRYYAGKRFKKDSMAKGKAMHQRLHDAYLAARRAEGKLRRAIASDLDKAEVEELALLQADPKRQRLWRWRGMYRNSKLLLKLFADHRGKPPRADAEKALEVLEQSRRKVTGLKKIGADRLSADGCIALAKKHVAELTSKSLFTYPPEAKTKGWEMYSQCHKLREHNASWGLLR